MEQWSDGRESHVSPQYSSSPLVQLPEGLSSPEVHGNVIPEQAVAPCR